MLYFIDGCHLDDASKNLVHGLHIDNPNPLGFIEARIRSRVITLQADGHELDAVMWGLGRYVPTRDNHQLREMRVMAHLHTLAVREFYPNRDRSKTTDRF